MTVTVERAVRRGGLVCDGDGGAVRRGGLACNGDGGAVR